MPENTEEVFLGSPKNPSISNGSPSRDFLPENGEKSEQGTQIRVPLGRSTR